MRRILNERSSTYHVETVYSNGGYGYLKRQARGFNNAAKNCPFLLLTDLDKHVCPAALLEEWLGCPKQKNFLARVAVREVEAWILGDSFGLAAFIGVKAEKVPSRPESLTNPKHHLLQLATFSPRRTLKDAIVAEENGTLYQGPDYNGALAPFVKDEWDIAAAARACISLKRCLKALDRLELELMKRPSS